MYRVDVLSGMPTIRYCFTKKSARKLVKLFEDNGHMVQVAKFVRLHHDIFSWSAYEAEMALYSDKEEENG